MVYCLISLRIIGSIYINHFETPTHLNYVGHNPKKRDTHTLGLDVTLGILIIPLTYHLESCHILEELAVKKGKSEDL